MGSRRRAIRINSAGTGTDVPAAPPGCPGTPEPRWRWPGNELHADCAGGPRRAAGACFACRRPVRRRFSPWDARPAMPGAGRGRSGPAARAGVLPLAVGPWPRSGTGHARRLTSQGPARRLRSHGIPFAPRFRGLHGLFRPGPVAIHQHLRAPCPMPKARHRSAGSPRWPRPPPKRRQFAATASRAGEGGFRRSMRTGKRDAPAAVARACGDVAGRGRNGQGHEIRDLAGTQQRWRDQEPCQGCRRQHRPTAVRPGRRKQCGCDGGERPPGAGARQASAGRGRSWQRRPSGSRH